MQPVSHFTDHELHYTDILIYLKDEWHESKGATVYSSDHTYLNSNLTPSPPERSGQITSATGYMAVTENNPGHDPSNYVNIY